MLFKHHVAKIKNFNTFFRPSLHDNLSAIHFKPKISVTTGPKFFSLNVQYNGSCYCIAPLYLLSLV